MLAELKICFISLCHTILHQFVSLLARGYEAFAAYDDDVAYTTLIEHRIEMGNSLLFREKARSVPYVLRIFIETELDRLLRLGIMSVAKPGECIYASPILVLAK